jgi:hypothetical protein
MKSMKNKFLYLHHIALAMTSVATPLSLIPTITATPPSERSCGVTPVIEHTPNDQKLHSAISVLWSDK